MLYENKKPMPILIYKNSISNYETHRKKIHDIYIRKN